MTNPSDIIRFHSRNNGRASVYEANMAYQAYSNGVLHDGRTVVKPNNSADMNVKVVGNSSRPVVAIAENSSGYKVAIDIVGETLVKLSAPSSGTYKYAIVAYTNDLSASGSATETGNSSTCGLIAVSNKSSEPNDSRIRQQITSDGGTGVSAAYSILAIVSVSSGTSTITSSKIENRISYLDAGLIKNDSIGSDKLATNSVNWKHFDISSIYPHIEEKRKFKAISGTVNISMRNKVGRSSISFPSGYFSGKPVIVGNLNYGATGGGELISTEAQSSTSGRVSAYQTQGNTNSYSIPVYWIAMEYKD